eukprot:GFUD01023683.1.p1 GENE.GFUD01023683.1~~GFUD01023683.1.p1  ORF type:complete len:152 (+),score=54.39 GFUD01023683.1:116-571(+)
MAQQGAALQTYNNELVKSLEELMQRRAALQAQIEAETAEKTRLEAERARVEERLGVVDNSLQKKLGTRTEYDRVIQEAEQAYLKILESSQLLLNVVKSRSSDLRTGGSDSKVGEEQGRGVGRRGSQVQGVTPQTFPHITSSTDSGYPYTGQ